MYFITVNGIEYELNTTLRAAKVISSKFKSSLPEITGRLGTAHIDELITILQLALIDKSQGQQLEESILDGAWGAFELYSAVSNYLLELTYPGTPDEKERQIAAASLSDEQKNELRATMGLPTMSLSAASDFGNN